MNIQVSLRVVCGALVLAACNPKPNDPEPAPAAPSATPQEKPSEHAEHAAAAPLAVELPPVPAGANVTFAQPLDGAALQGPLENGKIAVPVQMSAVGIALKPAGPVEAGTGHHHIVIDAEPPPAGTVVPADEQHLHFGKAQTEATVWLTPGEHTLALQFADGIHRSYGPQLSSKIKVTVTAAGAVGTAPATGAAAAPAAHDKGH